MRKIFTLFASVILATSAWAISQVGGIYQIGTLQDWKEFAALVNGGSATIQGALTADVDLGSDQTMVGSGEATPFKGTFDGQGYTLTIHYNSTAEYCAPFRYIEGASFRNLKVAGTITTTNNYAAGIAGRNINSVPTFNKCATDVAITSSSTTLTKWSRYDYHGCLLAHTISMNVLIENCACGGSINGSSSSQSYCAGLVGVAEGCTVSASRSLSTTSYTNVCIFNSLCHSSGATRDASIFYYINANDPTNVGTQVTASALNNNTYVVDLGTSNWVLYTRTHQPMLTQFAKYSVTYNANGGSSAPAAQSKRTYEGIYLSNTTLTRTGLVHSGWNTKADGTGTHYNKNAYYSTDADLTLYAEWTFEGSGTAEDPYRIPSTEAWNLLAERVNAGTNYSGKYFLQTADISVTTMVGYFNDDNTDAFKEFSGTYDGDGHTLTVSYTSSHMECAPFRFVDGVTIKNLHIAGTITTSAKDAAGLIGRLKTGSGVTNIINCRSSVTITSSVNGDGTHGGFVAITRTKRDQTTTEGAARLNFIGCVFDGELLGPSTNSCGGFVGWTETATMLYFTDCLFAPTTVTIGTSNSATFARVRNSASFHSTNTYYKQTFNTAQGKRHYAITGASGVTVANAGSATEYNVSGITSYGTGILYGGELYGGNGDVISLNLDHAAAPVGHSFSHYSVDHGNLTGSSNPYTLAMANADAVISANYSVNQYTITFNSNGGSAVDPITQDYGTDITAPADPTRTGYTFAGWSSAIPATMPAENVELTAQWTINQYTISFNSNGGSAVDPITQDYNTAVTAPAAPTKTGYIFAGWDPAVPSTMPAEDVELTAQWNVDTSILLNDADVAMKSILNALMDSEPRDINIGRSISRDGNYSTLCLPFDLDAAHIASSSLNGFVICELTDMWSVGNELRLLMTQRSSIEAGMPYLVRYAQTPTDPISLEFQDVTVSASVGGSTSAEGAKMHGILEPTHLEVDNHNILFLMANNIITWPKVDNAMNAFRAYFDVTPTPKTSTFYRGMPTRIVEQRETPTGIEEVTGDGLPVTGVQKIIRDGRLIIICGDREFNAQGQILK